MNRCRKERIKKICEELRRCLGELNDIHDEEEEYHDNIPDNLQGSERAETSEEAIESLDNAADSISEACDYLEEII